MLYSGTGPDSYITEYASDYEDIRQSRPDSGLGYIRQSKPDYVLEFKSLKPCHSLLGSGREDPSEPD